MKFHVLQKKNIVLPPLTEKRNVQKKLQLDALRHLHPSNVQVLDITLIHVSFSKFDVMK